MKIDHFDAKLLTRHGRLLPGVVPKAARRLLRLAENSFVKGRT